MRHSKPGRKSDAPRSDRRGTTSANTANRRKSIKASTFADEYSDLLKPAYKYYQAMQFATHGAHFQGEADYRVRCVHMLLDAAKECHKPEDYPFF